MLQPIVLLISGNESQVSLYRRRLQEAGYQVFEANCGVKVPERLVQVQPQLALLDWNLPDLSALVVIHAIRSQQGFTRLPVILIGRNISCEDRILSLEAGVDFCLDGAVYPKELAARMRTLLRKGNPSKSERTEF
jgi:two-component system, OmpR family, phosphate regulon response regulator PhoB